MVDRAVKCKGQYTVIGEVTMERVCSMRDTCYRYVSRYESTGHIVFFDRIPIQSGTLDCIEYISFQIHKHET